MVHWVFLAFLVDGSDSLLGLVVVKILLNLKVLHVANILFPMRLYKSGEELNLALLVFPLLAVLLLLRTPIRW